MYRYATLSVDLIFKRFLLVAYLSKHQPGWPDSDSPERKVPIHRPNFGEDRDRGDAIADCLPSRLSTSEQRSISNDFRFILGKLSNEEIQKEVVELEANRQENEDGKTATKTCGDPVVCWVSRAKLGDQNSSPQPPSPLKNSDRAKGTPGAESQGDGGSVQIVSEQIAAYNRDNARQE